MFENENILLKSRLNYLQDTQRFLLVESTLNKKRRENIIKNLNERFDSFFKGKVGFKKELKKDYNMTFFQVELTDAKRRIRNTDNDLKVVKRQIRKVSNLLALNSKDIERAS